MSYGVRMLYPNGEEEELDERFETEEEAREMGSYYCGCYKTGGEILYNSNGGDYPEDDGECEYEIFED